MGILDNAVAAIQVGIEDYQSQDQRRLLAAVRNIFAGILLLAKEHLFRQSPADSNEALIKARIRIRKRPDGSLAPEGIGRRTVDASQIMQRFSDLGVSFDWRPLESVQEVRNDVEHYYFAGTQERVRQAVHDAQIVIHRLVVDVLNEDPAHLLGHACWGTMLQESQIYEAEWQACAKSLEAVDWVTERAQQAVENLRCPNCASNLIRHRGTPVSDQAELDLFCAACGEQTNFEACLQALLNNEYYSAAHFAIAEGDEDPVQRCPNCQAVTYVLEDRECANCGFSLPADARCAVCDQALSLDEYGEFHSLCSYHAYQGSKDD